MEFKYYCLKRCSVVVFALLNILLCTGLYAYQTVLAYRQILDYNYNLIRWGYLIMLLLNVYAQISAIYGSVCEHLLSIKMYTCTLLFLLIIWCGCIATWTDLTIPLLILWNGAGLTVSLSLLYDMRRIERLFTAKL